MTADDAAAPVVGAPPRPAAPRIEPVDPLRFAEAASTILREAWRPPALEYSPEYVRFQCGYPTTLPPVSLAAFVGDTPVGFVAATGRRSTIGEVYVSSFLSARPGSAPTLPIGILRQELRRLRDVGRPCLIFAQKGSVGETLLQVADSLRIARVPFGEYRVHAAMPRTADAALLVEEAPADAWASDAARLADPGLLDLAFDVETVAHLAAGGRTLLRVRDADGAVVAVAMRGVTATVTAHGVDRVPALHYIRLAVERPEPLAALVAHARSPESPVVLVPNVAALQPGILRGAGVRAAGSTFSAFLYPMGAELPALRGTALEIV